MSDSVQSETVGLEQAYAECRAIARREAKNFYYAFVALTEERRNAICAIYAFMRKADDLADDESFPIEERRKHLDAWLAEWRVATSGVPTSDPAFVAVRDTIAHFHIPLSLLDELVAGVTMDLNPATHEGPDTYASFDDLYRYCYLVASVVGLVSIRIFGYTDPRAEELAEKTGIAFQLTNILRDVAEDAERNRVYLPLEDLQRFHVSLDGLLAHKAGTPPSEQERALLAEIARRAEEYYRAADELLPLIDRESRPALQVLVSIYHGILARIEHAEYDVFSVRHRVPTAQKLATLGVGLAKMFWIRIFG